MFVYYLFSKKTADVGLLLTLNEMRAQKELAFSVTRTTFKLEPLVEELRGYGISLKMAFIWQIQQSRSHQGSLSGILKFNRKLDGRPLAGIYTYFLLIILSIYILGQCFMFPEMMSLWLYFAYNYSISLSKIF